MSRSRHIWRVLVGVVAVAVCLPVGGRTAGAAEQWFDVAGGGWGHGVGMSQWGAKGRADAGQGSVQILAAYYPGAGGQTLAPSTIRVRLRRAGSTTLVQPGATMVVSRDGRNLAGAAAPGQSVAIARWGGSVVASVAGGPAIDLGPTGYVGFTQGVPVSLSATGHRYRWGVLSFHATGTSGLDVVLSLSLEEYMRGVAEVPASWPAAALEAQAVAGRSFAAYRQRHPRAAHFDAEATTSDQYYLGYDHEVSPSASRWLAAVDRTSGRVLVSGGAPIQAFYSSSNGGYSEASDYVFVARLPYLVAAPDPYDRAVGNANHSWTQRYSGSELRAWLRAAGRPDVGSVVAIEVLGGVGASGRLDRASIRVRGTAGSDTLTGNQLRRAVNAGAPSSRDLKSTKFVVRGGLPGDRDPLGSFESAVQWGDRGVRVRGWAADPDAPGAALRAVVTVDGRLVAGLTADRPRPDVASVLPGYGPNHGFDAVVDAPGRSVTVCVAALNVGPGNHRLLGCRIVNRPVK